jgi:hypothetical protein
MIARWIAVVIATVMVCVVAGGAEAAAATKPFEVSDYPLEVRRSLSLGPVTCREVEGGGKVGFPRNTVRKVDFNGDGRLDYIVNFEATTCGGEKTGGFCGSGGCMVDFLVQLPNGRLRSVFVDQVLGYDILRGSPRKVRFWIHHGNCPNRTDGACSRTMRIGYRTFSPMR